MSQHKRIRLNPGGHRNENMLIELNDQQPLKPFDGRNPERPLSEEQQRMFEQVKRALNSGILEELSLRQQQCFTEHVISGDTLAVVASRHRISVSSVRTYVAHAGEKIRRWVEENE